MLFARSLGYLSLHTPDKLGKNFFGHLFHVTESTKLCCQFLCSCSSFAFPFSIPFVPDSWRPLSSETDAMIAVCHSFYIYSQSTLDSLWEFWEGPKRETTNTSDGSYKLYVFYFSSYLGNVFNLLNSFRHYLYILIKLLKWYTMSRHIKYFSTFITFYSASASRIPQLKHFFFLTQVEHNSTRERSKNFAFALSINLGWLAALLSPSQCLYISFSHSLECVSVCVCVKYFMW